MEDVESYGGGGKVTLYFFEVLGLNRVNVIHYFILEIYCYSYIRFYTQSINVAKHGGSHFKVS